MTESMNCEYEPVVCSTCEGRRTVFDQPCVRCDGTGQLSVPVTPAARVAFGYGTVTDYTTGQPIRPATAEEAARTEAKLASGDSDAYTGTWTDSNGRTVYVDA